MCAKHPHATEAAAVAFARQFPQPTRAYLCPQCDRWHLTRLRRKQYGRLVALSRLGSVIRCVAA